MSDLGDRMKPQCRGCGKPYSEFPLDVNLPRAQWLAINGGEDGGVLCAACIVERGAKLPGCTAAHLIFEVSL